MALLEDLIAGVEDPRLRAALAEEARELKQRTNFGLVFERHLPESVVLASKIGVSEGDEVRLRKAPSDGRRLRVTALAGEAATVTDTDGNAEDVAVSDLAVVKEFSEPVFPTLRPDGSVERGGDRPSHLVIEGENYHALQLLAVTHARQADCIYVDPPYNTGARDWKYNNRYVDEADTWRHSKWLSFIEKRLRLARQLLKPDGVLIVTIDEHEVHHLGVLLKQLFPDRLHYPVTIVNNPKGTGAVNFSRVAEYAFFVCPAGAEAIEKVPFAFGMPFKVPKRDHRVMEVPQSSAANGDRDVAELVRKLALRRDGAESSNRSDRPRQFYAIHVDRATEQVVGLGRELAPNEEPTDDPPASELVAVYPIDASGRHRVWRYGRQTMERLISLGEIKVGRFNEERDTYSLYHWKPVDAAETERRRPRTVWWHSSHDAGAHGASLLNTFLGSRAAFPFPKSVYAVADCLRLALESRPDAVVIDFFAGSGTTLHSTCLLNAEDGGTRRCLLVTNNEVEEKQAKRLNRSGHFLGDPEYERHGIFEAVTRPRCEAAITGTRPEGSAVPGKYLDGRPYAEGFEENCEFVRLDYFDPDRVELGLEDERLHPVLWLLAGGKGKRPERLDEKAPFAVVPDCGYAVLQRPAAVAELIEAIADRPEVEHVFIMTDSEQSYAQVTAALGRERKTHMLPRDYLRHFRSVVAENA